MAEDITILYYSASNNPEKLERSVIENINKFRGDIPVVSVTHRPIDFGHNICVGVHEPCYPNLFRQVQIGLKAIKTKYVLTCESDFMYSPEYFQVKPDGVAKLYRYDNVWVVFANKTNNRFHRKGFSDGAQLIDREMWLHDLTFRLGNEVRWYKKDDNIRLPGRYKDNSHTWSGKPCVTFKTNANVRANTQCLGTTKRRIEYWGHVEDMKKMVGL